MLCINFVFLSTSFAPYYFTAFAPHSFHCRSIVSLSIFPSWPLCFPISPVCLVLSFALSFLDSRVRWIAHVTFLCFFSPCTRAHILLNTDICYRATILSPSASGHNTAARSSRAEIGERTIFMTDCRWLRYFMHFILLHPWTSRIFRVSCSTFIVWFLSSSSPLGFSSPKLPYIWSLCSSSYTTCVETVFIGTVAYKSFVIPCCFTFQRIFIIRAPPCIASLSNILGGTLNVNINHNWSFWKNGLHCKLISPYLIPTSAPLGEFKCLAQVPAWSWAITN